MKYVDNDKRIILEKCNESFKERWDRFIKAGYTYNEEEFDFGKPVGRESKL